MRRWQPALEGQLWERTSGNRLGTEGQPEWLLNTPGCWGEVPCVDPTGIGAFTTAIEENVARATTLVDFTSLFPYNPDPTGSGTRRFLTGGFYDALVAGLKRTVAAGNRPLVRLATGTPPTYATRPVAAGFVDQLLADVGVSGSELPVAAADYSTNGPVPTSWNHGKILAVDGTTVITGGHNYWGDDYLQTTDPVDDVSVNLTGPVAGTAHRYADVLWSFICTHPAGQVDKRLTAAVGACPTQKAPPAPSDDEGATAAGMDVLTVARSGNGISVPTDGSHAVDAQPAPVASPCGAWPSDGWSDINKSAGYAARNPGEVGLRQLVSSATTSVFISQQDLLSCIKGVETTFDERLFGILAQKLIDGVDVTIVVSTPGATTGADGKSGYSNSRSVFGSPWTPSDVFDLLVKVVGAESGVDLEAAKATTCEHLAIASVRNAPDASAWPNGHGFANHAKMAVVDDAAFYVGSENLYPARLQEFGVMVEDPTALAQLRSEYLEPLWTSSAPGAYSDPAQGVCPDRVLRTTW